MITKIAKPFHFYNPSLHPFFFLHHSIFSFSIITVYLRELTWFMSQHDNAHREYSSSIILSVDRITVFYENVILSLRSRPQLRTLYHRESGSLILVVSVQLIDKIGIVLGFQPLNDWTPIGPLPHIVLVHPTYSGISSMVQLLQ